MNRCKHGDIIVDYNTYLSNPIAFGIVWIDDNGQCGSGIKLTDSQKLIVYDQMVSNMRDEIDVAKEVKK